MAERSQNVYAFACIKYEGRKCTRRKEIAILAARSGKEHFSDMKFSMIKYKVMLDWQGRTVTQPWNQLGDLLKGLLKIVCLLVQINPIIHLSVPFWMGGEKMVKLIFPSAVFQCCCTKNIWFGFEQVQGAVVQTGASTNLLRFGLHQTNLLNSPTATLSGTEGKGG